MRWTLCIGMTVERGCADSQTGVRPIVSQLVHRWQEATLLNNAIPTGHFGIAASASSRPVTHHQPTWTKVIET